MGKALLPFDKARADSADLRKDLAATVTTHGLSGAQRSSKSETIASTRVVRELRTGQTTGLTPVEQLANVSRQVLRKLGFSEIRRQCRIKFPRYNRKEINQLARKLHDEAWSKRDREAVARAKRG